MDVLKERTSAILHVADFLIYWVKHFETIEIVLRNFDSQKVVPSCQGNNLDKTKLKTTLAFQNVATPLMRDIKNASHRWTEEKLPDSGEMSGTMLAKPSTNHKASSKRRDFIPGICIN